MLIQTPLKLNDIVTIKLKRGEELIGKLVNENTGDVIEVKRPLIVMMSEQGFGLMPFMLTASPDATVAIDRSQVVGYAKTIEQVAAEYIKQTTGLHLPTVGG